MATINYDDWVALYRLKRHIQIVYDVAGECAVCRFPADERMAHEKWCPWPGINPVVDRDWSEHMPRLQADETFKLVDYVPNT